MRPSSRPLVGYAVDCFRSRDELIRENALLRKQLEVACRKITRPHLRPMDRAILVLLARLAPTWRGATLLVQPATILRWHREGFQLLWRRRSRHRHGRQQMTADTIELIKRMARNNRLWGAERIRGELLKLGIGASKRSIQKWIRQVRPRPQGQRWSSFLRTHVNEIWACDFLQTYDLLFRPIFAFFLIELGSRRVIHSAVTRSPTSAWVKKQLREATEWGNGPRFLIRDNDDKFGSSFDAVAEGTGITVLRTPIRAPNANAVCERFLRSVRRECLDHLIILGDQHLLTILGRYCEYFNGARPHQGIGQRVPTKLLDEGRRTERGSVKEIPILGGLHHEYRLAA
jgi:transposase InsO family protein